MHPILIHYPRPRRNKRRHTIAKRAIALCIKATLVAATLTALFCNA